GEPFYPTTLLNQIILSSTVREIFALTGDELNSVEFNCEIYQKNGITINTKSLDFLEHCILHRFNVLLVEDEAKKTLKCFYSRGPLQSFFDALQFRRLITLTLVLGIGCSNASALKTMRENLNKKSIKAISENDPGYQYSELIEQYGTEGNFTVVFSLL